MNDDPIQRIDDDDKAFIETAPWVDELSPEQLGRFRELQANPKELVDALRNDLELQVAVARADTRPMLRAWFSDKGEWRHEPERSGPVGPASVGTEWVFEGVHERDGAFNGLHATGRRVEIRGFTIMSAQPTDQGDAFKVRRYVDWAGLYGQLGLTVNWRVPVASPGRAAE